MKKKIILILVTLMFLFGCRVNTDESGEKTYSIDPNTSAKIESGVEGSAGVLTILTPLLGPSATIGVSALLTALGIWRKMKPKFTEAKNKADTSHAVAGSMVDAIEILKREHPDDWKHLEPHITKALDVSGIDTVVLENVIRGIRGLSPKG